jgi:hypothetical protein
MKRLLLIPFAVAVAAILLPVVYYVAEYFGWIKSK